MIVIIPNQNTMSTNKFRMLTLQLSTDPIKVLNVFVPQVKGNP